MYAVRITHFFSENTEELQRFRNALVRISEGVESRSIPSESGECDYEVLQRELGILEDELETGASLPVFPITNSAAPGKASFPLKHTKAFPGKFIFLWNV